MRNSQHPGPSPNASPDDKGLATAYQSATIPGKADDGCHKPYIEHNPTEARLSTFST